MLVLIVRKVLLNMIRNRYLKMLLMDEIIEVYRLPVVIFHVFWRDWSGNWSRRIEAVFDPSSTEMLSISRLVRRFLLLYSQYPVVY